MIDISKILDDLGIEYRGGGVNNYKISCINPAHDDARPSMYIHKESGILHCFSCGTKGNIFTLLASKGITGIDVLLYFRKFDIDAATEEAVQAMLELSVKKRSKEYAEEKIKYENIELPPHRMIETNVYLEGRGITPKEIKEWKMAVVTTGKHMGWILIPIYQFEILRNYFMRSTFGKGKLYGEAPRKDLLAGLDFTCMNDPVCITEGIFDTIAVKRAGMQSVACLSNRLLTPQIALLKQYKDIIIVPDNDKQGLFLVESASVLEAVSKISVASLPANKKDAADCSPAEIQEAFKHRVPWNEYLIRKKFIEKMA
jgi:DNA primase